MFIKYIVTAVLPITLRAKSIYECSIPLTSTTTAAEKLFITQQTLSNHIQRLETQYGVTLFERRPRLKLTPAGERMAHYAARIVRLERMMTAELFDLSKKSGGVLVLGCSRIRATCFLPRIWSTYQQRCPNIDIRLVPTNSQAMDDGILSRKIDMTIGLNSTARPNIHKEWLMTESVCFLISRSLFKEHFGEAAERKLRQFQNGIDCSDIVEIPMVLQPPTNYIRQLFNQQFELLDTIPRALFETNDSELILNMCCNNCGGAVLPESIIFQPSNANYQQLKNLYVFPIKNLNISSMISYSTDLPTPHYSQIFVDVCKTVFAESRREMDRQKEAFFNNLKEC